MIRLFVAIELPDDLKNRLSLLQGGVPGAAWISPENFHVTLRFIGEVAENRLGEIDEILADSAGAAFDLSLAGVDSFSRGRDATSLWVGVERNAALAALQSRIDKSLTRAGFPSEEKRYTPHVTLARLKRAPEPRVAAFIAANNLFRAEPFRVGQVTLFSSFLSASGAIYSVEADYPLS